MSSNRSKIVQELDPETVEGYTKAQKRHYLSTGHRPYLDENGRVKWLTLTQYTVRGDARIKTSRMRQLFARPVTHLVRKRPHRPGFVKFLMQYWLTILVVALVVASAVVLYIRPELVMKIGEIF